MHLQMRFNKPKMSTWFLPLPAVKSERKKYSKHYNIPVRKLSSTSYRILNNKRGILWLNTIG
jgi:hypothetical protein